MRENGIPTDALESGKRKLLIVDDDEELGRSERPADATAHADRVGDDAVGHTVARNCQGSR